jgi:hypothetical protein
MGDSRWWEVRRLPASGNISNVSALVLPEAMPVAEHGQMPMFPDDVRPRPEELRELLEVVRIQARTIERLTGKQDGTIGSLRGRSIASLRSKAKRGPRGPHLPKLRTWAGCVDYYQELERSIREKRKLAADDLVTKKMMYGWGGPQVKTINYHMRGYGLRPDDDWPPSAWKRDDDRIWKPPSGKN